MLATLQPTKEQVRAYMLQRQRAFERRHGGEEACDLARDDEAGADTSDDPDLDPDLLTAATFLLPGTIAQLATLLAVEWCFLAAGISRPN